MNANANARTNTGAKLTYAGFWRRLAALLLDLLLLFILTGPLLYLVYGNDYFYWLLADNLYWSYGFFDFLLTKLFPVIAILVFWHQLGATPGKFLLGCRIVDATTHQAVSWKQALIRLGGYVISSLPAYLGFIWAAWDKRKQGLHDKLAHTVVLHIEDDYCEIPLTTLMDNLK